MLWKFGKAIIIFIRIAEGAALSARHNNLNFNVHT